MRQHLVRRRRAPGDRAVRHPLLLSSPGELGKLAHGLSALDPLLTAVHPMGTLALGTRRRRAWTPARRRWRLWSPTAASSRRALGGPPQLTIYAAGHKIAGHLVEELRRNERSSLPLCSSAAASACAICSPPTHRIRRRSRRSSPNRRRPLTPRSFGCPSDARRQRLTVRALPRRDRRCGNFAAGAVASLIFSGGAAHSPDVEAEVMGALAEHRGVPAGDVFREGRALTTWQNFRFSLAILRAACARHGARDLDGRSPAACAPHRALLGPRRRAHALLSHADRDSAPRLRRGD